MNSLLGYSYSNSFYLNEKERRIDDLRVKKNRKKLLKKSKYILLSFSFLVTKGKSASSRDLISLTPQQLENAYSLAPSTDQVHILALSLIRKKKYLYFYYYTNSGYYYLFYLKGKIWRVPEYQVSLAVYIVTIIVSVAIYKICRNPTVQKKWNSFKTKLKTKLAELAKFKRGGGYALPYEKSLSEGNLETNLVGLNKCCRPSPYYRMIGNALALLLFHDIKSEASLSFKGLNFLAKNAMIQCLMLESPVIAGVLAGIKVGSQLDKGKLTLTNGITPFFYGMVSIFLQWHGAFMLTTLARDRFLMDYFDQLPKPYSLSGKALEEVPRKNQVTMVQSEPKRNETFVSTAPGTNLYYECKKPLSIPTLDGVIKQGKNLKGDEVIYWKELFQKDLGTESKFIPLSERTRTLADLKDLDSFIPRESTEKIWNSIEDIEK